MLWPSQHCHARRAGPCPCFGNTELSRSDSATQQLCHPSCRLYSHLVQWRRTRGSLDHTVPKKERKFSLSIAEGLFTPQKSENWFFPPWSTCQQISFLSNKIMTAFQLQCLCLTCSEKESKVSNQRRSGLHGCTCISSMPKMHILLYHPSSCCNLHTSLEILRHSMPVFHATRWDRI